MLDVHSAPILIKDKLDIINSMFLTLSRLLSRGVIIIASINAPQMPTSANTDANSFSTLDEEGLEVVVGTLTNEMLIANFQLFHNID